MPNVQFPYFKMGKDTTKSSFFSWLNISSSSPTFNFQELVNKFFPSAFYLACSRQNQNLEVSWRELFINSMVKVRDILPYYLKPLLTTAVQGDAQNFGSFLKKLSEDEFENFFHPNINIEKWLEVITRCDKSILIVLYDYIKTIYKNNSYPEFQLDLSPTSYWSLLDWAIVCQQSEEVKSLLTKENIKKIYNIDFDGSFDPSLLQRDYLTRFIHTQRNAVTYSDINTVEILIDKVKDFLSIRFLDAPTPLWFACINTHMSMVSFLLSQNQDPNEASSTYPPIITRLVQDDNYIAVFNLLIKHPKFNINAKHDSNNQLPLIAIAARTNAINTVKLILKHYRTNIPEEDLEHALVLAVTNDSFEAAKALLDANVNPTIPNYCKKLEQQQNSTKRIFNSLPVVKAKTNNNLKMLALLVKYHVNVPDGLLARIVIDKNTPKEAVMEIKKLSDKYNGNTEYKDKNFFNVWLNNVDTSSVTTWEDLLKTMRTTLNYAENFSVSLSKDFILQFKQAMEYIEIKIQLEKNKTAEFDASVNNNNNFGFKS